jgi:GT2 family glycosyltransferase
MRAVLDQDPEIGVARPMLRVFGDTEGVWDWMVVPYDFDLLTRRNIAPCCALFRREAWERVGGYDENLSSWEDWDFWISVCEHGYRMGEVREPLLHHRISRDGKFATNLHRRLELISAIVRNHAEVYGEAAVRLADRVRTGEDVEAELADPPHPIFSWSLSAL